jgi:GAF domain-containing protein
MDRLQPGKKRSYYTDQPPPLQVDTARLFDREVSISEAFAEFTRALGEHFDINRGVLILREPDTEMLSAVSTWREGVLVDGLMINLPKDSSLFEKISDNGCCYTEQYCGTFSGNFFERKLLLDENSQSFAVQPLKYRGEVIGLIGFSSETPTAFAMFEEGVVEDLARKFAEVVDSKTSER